MSYRENVLKTANKSLTKEDWLIAATLGILGESGEFSEHIKKFKFHNKPLDKSAILLELGDIRYYLEMLCWALDTSLEEIEAKNIDKLNNRYPGGFK